MLLYFVNAVVSKIITFFRKCNKILRIMKKNLYAFSRKKSNLFKHFKSLLEVKGVLFDFVSAVLSKIVTFF